MPVYVFGAYPLLVPVPRPEVMPPLMLDISWKISDGVLVSP